MARPLDSSSPSAARPVTRADDASAVYTQVTRLIADELRAVEACFADELTTDVPAVQALLRYVSRFRGKMLRPTLLLLTGKSVGKLTQEHVVLATVVEMVHMATLVHDDVLDEAELRRKGATINHLKGNEAAVMLGDLLISHAFHLCSSLDSQAASRLIGRTTNEVCEGELMQIDQRNNLALTEADYLRIISKKTAALVATSCRLGAVHAGATPEQADAMERFGRCIGTAFQIQDDVLDLIGDVREVGKTLGIDVEKGKLTLPLIHFLRAAPREHRELLKSLLLSQEPDKVEKIRNLILPSGSIEYARQRAESLVQEARACLGVLASSEARDALDACARFVVERAV
ncbi:MAG: polyprenyl synthetase family protein [Tepidisphaerales bacterium]